MSNVIWQRITKQRQARLERAAALLNARQAREVHPDGTFEKHGVWYPSDTERQPCCEGLRNPTRKYPYSLIVHCRTAKHIAHLCDVPKALLKQTAVAMPHWETRYVPVQYTEGEFRACVAPEDGSHIAMCDLGQEMPLSTLPAAIKDGSVLNARERRNCSRQGGGYAVYPAPDAAMKAELTVHPTHILKVQVAGRHAMYGTDDERQVYERLKPVDIAVDVGNSRVIGGFLALLLPQQKPPSGYRRVPNSHWRGVPLIHAETLDIAINAVIESRLPIGTKLYSPLYRKPVWELTPAIAEFLDKAACWAVDTAEQFQRGQTRWCS